MASNSLLRQIQNLIARFVLQRVDDSKKMQTCQITVLADETRENVERVQNYGFTSVPFPGAEGVAVFPGGDRAHAFVIATDDRRYRLTGLQNGEVAIYTDQGDKVVIERGGTIRVTAATKVVVSAPLVELAGNTEAALKGTTYRAAEDVMLTALSSALSALAATIPAPTGGPMIGTPVQAAAVTAAVTAITAFQSAAATYLSPKVKLS